MLWQHSDISETLALVAKPEGPIGLRVSCAADIEYDEVVPRVPVPRGRCIPYSASLRRLKRTVPRPRGCRIILGSGGANESFGSSPGTFLRGLMFAHSGPSRCQSRLPR
jgi:hypothetical protein